MPQILGGGKQITYKFSFGLKFLISAGGLEEAINPVRSRVLSFRVRIEKLNEWPLLYSDSEGREKRREEDTARQTRP